MAGRRGLWSPSPEITRAQAQTISVSPALSVARFCPTTSQPSTTAVAISTCAFLLLTSNLTLCEIH